MAAHDPDLEALLKRASQGDRSAQGELLKLYQDRLRKWVEKHLDYGLVARLDPLDVVQEVFVDAWKKLLDYLQRRPCPSTPGFATLPKSA